MLNKHLVLIVKLVFIPMPPNKVDVNHAMLVKVRQQQKQQQVPRVLTAQVDNIPMLRRQLNALNVKKVTNKGLQKVFLVPNVILANFQKTKALPRVTFVQWVGSVH